MKMINETLKTKYTIASKALLRLYAQAVKSITFGNND